MGVLALSVVGGLFVGSWAIGHFREGLEDEERKKLIRYVAGAAVVGAAVWIFDLDKRFWDIDAATKWADEEASKAWAAHQAGSP